MRFNLETSFEFTAEIAENAEEKSGNLCALCALSGEFFPNKNIRFHI
jgi:hypothetical protein